MITVLYFLLLAMASAEDYKSHRVNRKVVHSVWLLGLIRIIFEKENRWVTVALTCICFTALYTVYILVRRLEEQYNRKLMLGGADVRLIPAMMLAQGWDKALTGVFVGLVAALLYYAVSGRRKREIPLVPWMSTGCLMVQIIYLFF